MIYSYLGVLLLVSFCSVNVLSEYERHYELAIEVRKITKFAPVFRIFNFAFREWHAKESKPPVTVTCKSSTPRFVVVLQPNSDPKDPNFCEVYSTKREALEKYSLKDKNGKTRREGLQVVAGLVNKAGKLKWTVGQVKGAVEILFDADVIYKETKYFFRHRINAKILGSSEGIRVYLPSLYYVKTKIPDSPEDKEEEPRKEEEPQMPEGRTKITTASVFLKLAWPFIQDNFNGGEEVNMLTEALASKGDLD